MRSILGASFIQRIRSVEYSVCEISWTRCEPAATSEAVRRLLRFQTAMHLHSILIPGWRGDLDPRTILLLVLVRSLNVEPVDCDSWLLALSETTRQRNSSSARLGYLSDSTNAACPRTYCQTAAASPASTNPEKSFL